MPVRGDDEIPEGDRVNRFWTVPNAICVCRLGGALILVGLAHLDKPVLFLGAFLVLTLSDWIDGKLANWLSQRSRIGPRLDSLADAAMYAGLLVGLILLQGRQLLDEWVFLAPALASYIASTLLGLAKFRQLPSYHTRSAKTSWLLVMLGVIFFVPGWSVWPLRVAAIAVTLANLEAVAIGWVLPRSESDVRSLREALARRSRCGSQSD